MASEILRSATNKGYSVTGLLSTKLYLQNVIYNCALLLFPNFLNCSFVLFKIVSVF